QLQSVLIEHGDGPGPFGSKGLGEGGTFCPAPAVGNAVARAVGVRIKDLPLTPEKGWRGLRSRAEGRTGATGGAVSITRRRRRGARASSPISPWPGWPTSSSGGAPCLTHGS